MDDVLRIQVPGSKSMTHRGLIMAGLARGDSILNNCLESDDTLATMNAIKCLGARIESGGSFNQLKITGTGGHIQACDTPLSMEESGTSLRLLACVAALGKHEYHFTGKGRLNERPMTPLIHALRELGVIVICPKNEGCTPLIIKGPARGDVVHIDASLSSQFLSGLLMMGGTFEKGLKIRVTGEISSLPYVLMTIDTMKHFGAQVEVVSKHDFMVYGGGYQATQYQIEGDASSASYFWAAAALTKRPVSVSSIPSTSLQTDVGILKVLEKMGADVTYLSDDSIIVKGGSLSAVDVDVNHIPDQVPTLAVLAAFAKGKSRFYNIAHLRHKESDRLSAISENLKSMHIHVHEGDDFLEIEGGDPKPVTIKTRNDHRLAMAFSLAGLVIPGMDVDNPLCVNKSFPGFWEEFSKLKKGL